MARTRKFNLDEAITRALRESIEAHAREWEPRFETGVGPVGDDAPFDDKVNEECDDCCPKCGKKDCVCKGDMNEGEIPADSREWEPDFETGVGEVGDDNPFTQAVNESMLDTEDWEEGSFGAREPKKVGIAFADGGDECENGDVATGQKNSGEVISKDNLSESADEGEDEGFLRNVGQGLKAAFKPAIDRFKGAYKDGKAQDAAMKSAKAYAGDRNNYEKDANGNWQLKQQGSTSTTEQPAAEQPATEQPAAEQPQADKPSVEQPANQGNDMVSKADIQKWMENHANEQDKNGAWENLWQFVTGKAQLQESKKEEKDVIAEEQDRFFNIINRIEKLYD